MTPEEIELMTNSLAYALIKGWRDFQKSGIKQKLDDYLHFLRNANFYESPFSHLFPSPAYDAAAKEIGRNFLETAACLSVSFDAPFPGDFSESREISMGSHEVRSFCLRAYTNGVLCCTFEIDFAHRHDKLDFPEAPSIRVIQAE